MGTKAALGGYRLLGSEAVKWSMVEGVRPYIGTFNMIPNDADALAAGNTPVTLTIDDVTFKNLYVLNVVAGENPSIKRVKVADRRIWWTYPLIRRCYNMRRNIGTSRIVDPASPPENLSISPKVWFARWTLFNQAEDADPKGAKWSPIQTIEDVLKEVQQAEKEYSGQLFSYVLRPDLRQMSPQLDIEDLMLKEPGDQALLRLLSYMPELGVYVDPDGIVVFYSKLTGAERAIVQNSLPKIVGEGDVVEVNNQNLRPRRMNVYFQIESEIRLNFSEAATTRTADERYCDNVLPIPDFSLTVSGQELCQGTYITFDQALAAWGTVPGYSGPLTHTDIQQAMVPYMDLWAGIELSGSFNPNVDWAARIASINQHYRKTYRINRNWMDKIFKLKAYRTATVNQATGTRAPAIAYSDYAVIAGQRALFNESRNGVSSKDASYAINVKGYPLNGVLSSTSKAAPATVTIEDADQGIIHLDFMVDPYRLFEAVLPSMVTLTGRESSIDAEGRPLFPGPSGDITKKGRPISWDAVSSSSVTSLPKLTANDKKAIILTAIPGAPNDKRGLFKVEVKPSDIASMLPQAARDGLSNAKGPTMEIYIGANVETARVPWLDSQASVIEQLFGVGGVKDQPPDISGIVLNNGPTSSPGGASLPAIARATAARFYATLADRLQGNMAGTMNKDLRLGGWLSTLEFSLETDGRKFSRLSLPDSVEPIDVGTYLDSSTRAMILRLADPAVTT